MKKINIILLAVVCGFTGMSWAGSLRLVKDSEKLSRLFSLMQELASNGANLEYFGFSENFQLPASQDEKCHWMSSSEVLEQIKEFSHEVFVEGSDSQENYEKILEDAMVDLGQILGGTRYYRCIYEEVIEYSFSRRFYFVAADDHFRVMFELGYEN